MKKQKLVGAHDHYGDKNPNMKYPSKVVHRICALLQDGKSNADVSDVILSEFPEFKYDFESLKKYIRCKIRQRMVRPDICDNYKY